MATAARLLRRLRAVPPAPALRPLSLEASAAGLPGVARAGLLISPRSVPFPFHHYSSRVSPEHGAAGFSEVCGHLERLNELLKERNIAMQQAINEQKIIKADLDAFDKELRSELEDLAKSVNTLRKVGNNFCMAILGVPLILVVAHHISS